MGPSALAGHCRFSGPRGRGPRAGGFNSRSPHRPESGCPWLCSLQRLWGPSYPLWPLGHLASLGPRLHRPTQASVLTWPPPPSRGLLPRVCFCPASFTRTRVDLGPTRVVWVPSCRAPEYACRDHRLCCPPGMGAISVAQRPQPGVLGRFHVPCLDCASLAPDPGPPRQGPPRWEAAVGRKASGSWAVLNSTCWV